MQRARIEEHHVAATPQYFSLGRNLVGSQLVVAGEAVVPFPGNNHASVVRGVKVRKIVVVAGLTEHNWAAPYLAALPVEFLNHHAGVVGPGNHRTAITSARNFRSVVRIVVGGELHAAGSPQGGAGRTDLGCRDLLISPLACVKKSQQGIALGINIEAVVFSGGVGQSGNEEPIVRELLHAIAIQTLEINRIAGSIRIVVEPAHVPLVVG